MQDGAGSENILPPDWAVSAPSNTQEKRAMRTPVRTLLATLACALPAVAQSTVAEPRASDNTEKLWRIEVTGISG